MKKLVLRNISKEFLGKLVLNNVNLEIDSPRIVLIKGPNGSGKTTLIRIIAGLIQPSNGKIEIYVDGKKVLDRRRIVGYVSHYPLIYDELSVKENIDFFAGLNGLKNTMGYEFIKSIISSLGLIKYLDSMTGNLSYEWKKRVDIARALIHNPEIILLDEPFTGLDEVGRQSLIQLFNELLHRDKIIILTSPIGDIDKDLEILSRFLDKKELREGSLV
ncbi:MAG: ATP-binding cassette domain-containing protein [Desulfurococcales archaeon]|jgi:ABC-type multidrug transport system ATPase subunit|nr:ATP-binding cassette domain-containing protein [Desulfurococcales archaeon]